MIDTIIEILKSDYLGRVIAGLTVFILTRFLTKRTQKRVFKTNLENFLVRLKMLKNRQTNDARQNIKDDYRLSEREKEIMKNTQNIVIAISKSFGKDFQVDFNKEQVKESGSDCWICDLEYIKDGDACENCAFNCSVWEGKLNVQLNELLSQKNR